MSKPFKSIDEPINLLKSRGLTFSKLLATIGLVCNNIKQIDIYNAY